MKVQTVIPKGRYGAAILAMLISLIGTPWMPKIEGGILVLEDINEHPFRVERMLLQLFDAGILNGSERHCAGQF